MFKVDKNIIVDLLYKNGYSYNNVFPVLCCDKKNTIYICDNQVTVMYKDYTIDDKKISLEEFYNNFERYVEV